MHGATEKEAAESAALFEALHRLLDTPNVTSHVNRRRTARRPFEYIQLLAYCDGRTPPTQADFRPTRCHDLSPGGFSFFATAPPSLPFVVIALGNVPFSFFLAQVVRVHIADPTSKEPYLLGCRFVKRLLSASDWE